MVDINKCYLGDNNTLIKYVDTESINLICTSPPYKNSDGFSSIKLKSLFKELYRVLKPDSTFWLNFGHLAEDKFRPFEVCQLAIDSGFKLNETIIWVKNHYKPIQGHRRVNNLTEFIFLLYKNKMPKLNRLSIGIPYTDISNAKRFNSGKNLKCPGNVWNIPYETIRKKSEKPHNDRFPLMLPLNCIKLSGIPEQSIVLDPFAGSGTTLIAAKALNMNYIGMEINPKHIETFNHRLTLI